MKTPKFDLEWNVLWHDFNKDKIVPFNIFSNLRDFQQELFKRIKKGEIKTRDDVKEFISRECRYQYWSRAEYEVFVSGIVSKHDTVEKIDVYHQVEINLDRITDYVIQTLQIEFEE